jgi:hypothetical protein
MADGEPGELDGAEQLERLALGGGIKRLAR